MPVFLLIIALTAFALAGCNPSTKPALKGLEPDVPSPIVGQLSDLYDADLETVIAPYQTLINRMSNRTPEEVCSQAQLDDVEAALALDETSLVAYSIRFGCAEEGSPQRTMAQAAVKDLMQRFFANNAGKSALHPIHVRNQQEGYMLISALNADIAAMEILAHETSFVTRFMVKSKDTGEYRELYMTNFRFLAAVARKTAPNLDNAQLMVQLHKAMEKENAPAYQQYQINQLTKKRSTMVEARDMAKPLALDQPLAHLSYMFASYELGEPVDRAALERYAEMGYVNATVLLARMMMDESPMEKAKPRIMTLFENSNRVAQSGAAHYILSDFLFAEGGIYEKLGWEMLYEAAYLQNDEAQNDLAERLVRGKGVDKDVKKGIHYHKQASAAGNYYSTLALGKLYRSGHGEVLEKDYAKAYEYFKLAKQQGHLSAGYYLGLMHFAGQSVEKSRSEAFKWYRYGAMQGSRLGMYQLGRYYRHGFVEEKNIGLALFWITRSAYLGYNVAHSALAEMFRKGEGLDKSIDRAIELYTTAFEMGYRKSAEALQNIYETEPGYIDSEKALYWMSR